MRVKNVEPPIPCWRCGIAIEAEVYRKRLSRRQANPDECKDCNDIDAKQKTIYSWVHPELGRITCKPYKGELDDDWRPITKEGRLYMPGNRICGMKDCVEVSHVKPRVMLTADAVETLLAQVEAQDYRKRETPSKTNLKGATE